MNKQETRSEINIKIQQEDEGQNPRKVSDLGMTCESRAINRADKLEGSERSK